MFNYIYFLYVLYINMPHFIESIKKYLKNCKVFVDVGSQVGIYTKLAYENMENGIIYSFEPQPERINKEFLSLNKSNINVNYYHLALSDKNGKINLYKDTIGTKIKPNRQPTLVNTRTLDSMINNKEIKIPDIIKIDIEGGEYYMLLGSKDLIRKGKTIFFIEIHHQYLESEEINIKNVLDLFDKNIYNHEIIYLVDGKPINNNFYSVDLINNLKSENKYEIYLKSDGSTRKTRLIYYIFEPKILNN